MGTQRAITKKMFLLVLLFTTVATVSAELTGPEQAQFAGVVTALGQIVDGLQGALDNFQVIKKLNRLHKATGLVFNRAFSGNGKYSYDEVRTTDFDASLDSTRFHEPNDDSTSTSSTSSSSYKSHDDDDDDQRRKRQTLSCQGNAPVDEAVIAQNLGQFAFVANGVIDAVLGARLFERVARIDHATKRIYDKVVGVSFQSTDYSDLLATSIDPERFPGKGKRNVQQALSFDEAVCDELPRLFGVVAALAKVFEEDDLVAKTIQIDAAVGRLYMFAMKEHHRKYDKLSENTYTLSSSTLSTSSSSSSSSSDDDDDDSDDDDDDEQRKRQVPSAAELIAQAAALAAKSKAFVDNAQATFFFQRIARTDAALHDLFNYEFKFSAKTFNELSGESVSADQQKK